MSTTNSRDLVSKALTDPSFRKLLETQPAKALGVKALSATQVFEVKKALAALKKGGKTFDVPCGIA
ncbi:MAG: hypothetical protein LLG04_05490 [Parachlamydia sp.]|nr:hypothetical protein [Parachlamydia sp.]